MVARPAVLKGAFLDTSVLLAGLIDLGAPAAGAQRLFDAVAAGRLGRPRTAWHCCLEFHAVATRLPQEFRLKPSDATTLLEAEVLARFDVADLPAGRRLAFLAASGRESIAGGRIYDTHIAAVARASGARAVVTDNPRDFTRLEAVGVLVLDAAAAVRLLGLGRGGPRRPS